LVKGVVTRSTLEAHWAKFFDLAGLEWHYEPRVFLLGDGTTYRPDFYVEGLGYIEIKPSIEAFTLIREKIRRFLFDYPDIILYLFPASRVFLRDVFFFHQGKILHLNTGAIVFRLARLRCAQTGLSLADCSNIILSAIAANSKAKALGIKPIGELMRA
jgi:hypothetical protein